MVDLPSTYLLIPYELSIYQYHHLTPPLPPQPPTTTKNPQNIKIKCITRAHIRYLPSNLDNKEHQIPKLKYFSSRLAVVFA